MKLKGPEYVENIFSCSIKKRTCTRETDKIKSWAILQNFSFFMLKLTKTPILPNCQVSNGVLTIQKSNFCKVA
jgi:hypothetical protein